MKNLTLRTLLLLSLPGALNAASAHAEYAVKDLQKASDVCVKQVAGSLFEKIYGRPVKASQVSASTMSSEQVFGKCTAQSCQMLATAVAEDADHCVVSVSIVPDSSLSLTPEDKGYQGSLLVTVEPARDMTGDGPTCHALPGISHTFELTGRDFSTIEYDVSYPDPTYDRFGNQIPAKGEIGNVRVVDGKLISRNVVLTNDDTERPTPITMDAVDYSDCLRAQLKGPGR